METIRGLVLRGEQFAELGGYRIESHRFDSVVLTRQFAPAFALGVPATIAVVALLFSLFFDSLSAGKYVALGAAAVAVLLPLVVRVEERLIISASARGSGSLLLVTGVATEGLRDYLASLASD